jgi:hypothetical protein
MKQNIAQNLTQELCNVTLSLSRSRQKQLQFSARGQNFIVLKTFLAQRRRCRFFGLKEQLDIESLKIIVRTPGQFTRLIDDSAIVLNRHILKYSFVANNFYFNGGYLYFFVNINQLLSFSNTFVQTRAFQIVSATIYNRRYKTIYRWRLNDLKSAVLNNKLGLLHDMVKRISYFHKHVVCILRWLNFFGLFLRMLRYVN